MQLMDGDEELRANGKKMPMYTRASVWPASMSARTAWDGSDYSSRITVKNVEGVAGQVWTIEVIHRQPKAGISGPPKEPK